MRVSSPSSDFQSQNKTEKTEKKSSSNRKRTVTSEGAAEEKKTERKSSKKTVSSRNEDTDAEVQLSPKAKTKTEAKTEAAETAAAPEPKQIKDDRDLKEAETLMKHINSGQLPGGEQELALKRVGQIIKKYGNA